MNKKSQWSVVSGQWSSGFTLVELLIVIALIGILAAAVVTLLNPLAQFQKTRDTQRKSDLAQVQRALEQYYNDWGFYPVSSGNPNYYILDSAHAWGTAWTPYEDYIPKDPLSTSGYNYRYVQGCSGQCYYLYARIERNTADSQICFPANGNVCTNAPGVACGPNAGDCNYGVSSANVSP